jgi:hypothetical protein
MRGKKEVAKTTAKLVSLDQVSANDSAVIDHASGRATISEVRFGGKKYALVIGGDEKAEISGGSNK